MKRTIVFFISLSILAPLAASAASASITEIMYDAPGSDTGREWVEVENTGPAGIDLSAWKFFQGNTNHKIVPIGQSQVAAGSYAVIVEDSPKFMADNPGFSGQIFTSSFSLNNTGEAIAVKDDSGATADTVSYSNVWGATGDGNSLQKTSLGSWIASTPTPGTATVASQSSAAPQQSGSNSSSSDATAGASGADERAASETNGSLALSAYSSQEIAYTSYQEPELQVASGRPRLGFVGSPLSFEAKVTSIKNPPSGKSISDIWAMGDGVELAGQSVDHIYQYPGDYIVILNSDFGDAHAVSKVSVKIVDPHTYIWGADQGSIELSNPDDYEMNIGGYLVSDDRGRYVVPRDTLIAPHSRIKLPYSYTKLAVAGTIELSDPSGRSRSRFIPGGAVDAPAEPVIALPAGFDAAAFKARFDELLEKNPQ